MNQHSVMMTTIETPLGEMIAGATDIGICLLEFSDRKTLKPQLHRISNSLKASLIQGQHPYFDQLETEILDYFNGNLKIFTVAIDMVGTEFQKKVWQQLLSIPYGETRCYQQQAASINNVNAVRAVAKCNGDNRISIIIPCHRVIGKNGKLTGYGGGLWRKQRLLDHENSQRINLG